MNLGKAKTLSRVKDPVFRKGWVDHFGLLDSVRFTSRPGIGTKIFVVDSELMEHGGMQIAHVNDAFLRMIPELVRRSVADATLDSTPAMEKPLI